MTTQLDPNRRYRLIAGGVACFALAVTVLLAVLALTCPSEGELGCLGVYLGLLFIGIPWTVAGATYALFAILPRGRPRAYLLRAGLVITLVLTAITLPAGAGILTAPLAAGLWIFDERIKGERHAGQ